MRCLGDPIGDGPLMRRAACLGRRGTGQGLVEFALVLPIFLLLLFGLIDVGRLVYMNSVLSQAAREGARTASVEAGWIGSSDPSCNQPGGPVCPANFAALKTDVTAAANRMVAPFASVSAVYISCDPQGSAPTGKWTTTSCANNTPGPPNNNVVSVRLVLTFQPITPIASSIVSNVTTFGSATMVIN
jgi:Flp pilus assembly protein TadG